ncbi:MAG: helix-turn-helix transcriptional regulator [Rhodocyclales bacterium]|nr:helix-turn-helix transcriptional regulator [Rhodocyclales bacterium]
MVTPPQRRDARLVVGSNIRRIRHQLGLTQEAVAEASGLHTNYVGGVERGTRNVSILNIDRFAIALGVTMADLVAELPKGSGAAKLPGRSPARRRKLAE